MGSRSGCEEALQHVSHWAGTVRARYLSWEGRPLKLPGLSRALCDLSLSRRWWISSAAEDCTACAHAPVSSCEVVGREGGHSMAAEAPAWEACQHRLQGHL